MNNTGNGVGVLPNNLKNGASEISNLAVQVRGLTKKYDKVTALNALDLVLPRGRFIGLLGENGCGKTTLLKILAGVLSEYEGEVRIAGYKPGPESKAKVAFLPDTSFLPLERKLDFVLGMYRDFFTDFDLAKAERMLAEFGLPLNMKLKAMSKGMREKAQVALTMSRRAEVYLLDEPISGMDPAAREVILRALVSDLPENSTVFISSHLVHDLEPVLESVVIMRAGQVLVAGEADDLRAAHNASLDEIFRRMHR